MDLQVGSDSDNIVSIYLYCIYLLFSSRILPNTNSGRKKWIYTQIISLAQPEDRECPNSK